ncbi:MAG: hypothetical protein AB7D57_08845, partial [Desulfovibrionaceae bacterium]
MNTPPHDFDSLKALLHNAPDARHRLAALPNTEERLAETLRLARLADLRVDPDQVRAELDRLVPPPSEALSDAELAAVLGSKGSETWNGGSGNNKHSGSEYGDTLSGHGGNDTLYGNEGNDYL